ncbi:unnamed protein product [Effrenium voratum]|uniref:Uncharacterized protein n=1 Tax=Effrenium voratum TaxID=2562239 RepID=A0AA36I235_9DINO|nr:unnamed protein product [Effrenium voratum]
MHSAALQIGDETRKPRTSASKPRFSIFSPPCLARAQDLHRFAGNGASHCLRMTWQFDVLDRATSASITYFWEQRQTASHFTDISCQAGLFVMPGRCVCQVNSKSCPDLSTFRHPPDVFRQFWSAPVGCPEPSRLCFEKGAF